MSQESKPSRPRGESEQTQFAGRIVTLSKQLAQCALEKVQEQFGMPPTEGGQEILRGMVHDQLTFRSSQKRPHAAMYRGVVAGSDALAFSDVLLPEEGFRGFGVDPDYPARLLRLKLVYGENADDPNAQTWNCTLFSGEGVVPIMFDTAALEKTGDYTTRVKDIARYVSSIPSSLIHFPEEGELQAIRQGFGKVSADEVDLDYLFDRCDDEATSMFSTPLDQDAAWFREQRGIVRGV